MVTQAFVTSQLYYCKMLYMGMPLKTLPKLQLVQNVVPGFEQCESFIIYLFFKETSVLIV